MNTQPQLQQEQERHIRYGKIAYRIALIAFLFSLVIFLASVIYVANRKQDKPLKKEKIQLICPECDSMPKVKYQYDTGATGSLSHNPRTGRKGILINE